MNTQSTVVNSSSFEGAAEEIAKSLNVRVNQVWIWSLTAVPVEVTAMGDRGRQFVLGDVVANFTIEP